MDSKNRMTFAIISGFCILIVSIIIAYICFSILDSSAEATLKNWKLGGAFAAFVFTASMLTSIIFQIYKQMTSDKIEEYRQQIQELQNKLIKGAICPPDYVIDLDERHKIVFSRPSDWDPKGGVLYQYIKKDPLNIFHTNFNVVYFAKNDLTDLYSNLNLGAFDASQINIEKLYGAYSEAEAANLKVGCNAENVTLTKEYIFVDNGKSMKFIMTSTCKPNDKKIKLCQTGVITYVPRLKALFSFMFSSSANTYTESSEIFNNVITSIRFL
ncbi:MAG: hypothetical protein KJ915_02075 [Candidatus Omnitrophica bacterium]|nr:hypothetical protein [Candidatus Omnitrophota bacterium]